MSSVKKGLGFLVALFMFMFLLDGCAPQYGFVRKAAFKGPRHIFISFAGPVDDTWASNRDHYIVYERPDPDIRLAITDVKVGPGKTTVTLGFENALNQDQPHILTMKDILSEGKSQGTVVLTVKKLYVGYLLSILVGAAFINNFVFTKYLGLCVFFGVSRKRSTAVGMGITFTIVMTFSALMSWLLYQFVLKPFRLDFLEVVVFIGMVSLSVQAVDTILRKVNPLLFRAFGVYLVLVIANCIIIAVPLTLADNEYNMWESLILAIGAGAGFLMALFLMSCVRERLELANIPASYRGLPIAFIVAGLFALAFMGFSGMAIF
jgi:electron transport complex protein RnfA